MVRRRALVLLCLVLVLQSALHSGDCSLFRKFRERNRTEIHQQSKPWYRTKLALGWWNFTTGAFINAAKLYSRQSKLNLFDTGGSLPKHPEAKMTSVSYSVCFAWGRSSKISLVSPH